MGYYPWKTSVVVAVVDGGFKLSHVDLVNKWVAGYDVADGDNNPNIDKLAFSHGTHVSGIIGAETNNNEGVASIGNKVMIMPVKATPDDSEDPAHELTYGYEGIEWAAEHGADIINCSWGAYETLASGEDVIATATALGSLVVAAAGNDNTTLKHYPAGFPGVLAVASTDINDLKSSFSNSGTWVDVCAPGTHILSTVPDIRDGDYEYYNGTSMAAPMVSAVCALVKSVSSAYTPAEITQIVKSTANAIVNSNDPTYNGLLGTGRVDAYLAVREAYKCISDKTISTDILRTPFTECDNWIKTDGSCTVPANEQVIFDAGSYIELKPGFRATSGSLFRAHIDGCGGNKIL
jgi:subtilisin family serine protease